MAYEAAVRRILPLVLAMCASGCGGCVDNPSGSRPTAAQTPASATTLNPLVRSLRPPRFGLVRAGEDAAAAAAPASPSPSPSQGDAP